jgi:hypothetical protein
MAPRADSAALNLQPRQRREVYHALGKVSAGRSVKDLLGEVAMPERDIRESLRKLGDAGLARRSSGTWKAMSVDSADAEIAPS